jgi:hypothetical protein
MRKTEIIRGFVIAAVLISGTAAIMSCDDDKTVCPAPVTCSPSPPSEVYAENRDGFVYICWAPNPESDVAGYDIYRGEDLEGDFFWVGTVYDEEPDPYEYCFEYDVPANGEQYFYFVVAYDYDDN